MKKLFLASLILTFFASSCSREDISFDPANPVNGTWVFRRYDNTSFIFYRSDSFEDNHCYRFNSDGTLTERKNAGWCGTPPIVYSDFAGSWSQVNGSVLRINVGYWGGTTEYRLNIIEVNSDSLRVMYEYQD